MTKQELINYCKTYNDSYEDYPFDDNWALIRHKSNKKSFAIIYEREGKLFANLKCEPLRADFLRSVHKNVTAAYHMNKTHWNSVLIDKNITNEELYSMIEHSFSQTMPKKRKKVK